MTNTGTWNSDLALFFTFVFFSPVILYFLLGVALKVFEIYTAANPYAVVYLEQPRVFQESQKPIVQPSPRPTPEPKLDNNNEMYLDAVSGLTGLGYKKSEARRIISKACNEKDYKNAEDIISDVISSVYK